MSQYTEGRFINRYLTGEPRDNHGVTHAVAYNRDDDPIAACGRCCDLLSDWKSPGTQTVTCLRCWCAFFRAEAMWWTE